MVAKIINLILLFAIIASLGLAMVSMMRDKGRGTGMVKALTYRVAIWTILLLLIVAGLYTGIITPGNSLRVAATRSVN